MLMSELLSSFCVFAVGFAVRRIGKFPTEASCETQFREVSALPITVCFAVVFFCLLQYGFISPGPEVGCISLTLISALAAGIMLQLDVFSKMLKTQQYAADAVADAQRAQLELKKVRAAVSHGEAVQRLEHDMKNLLLLILGTVILGPAAEEMIFRGMLFRRAAYYAGMRKGILLSALCFGIYHGNVIQFLYAFLLGFLLAFVYERSGDLRAAVAAHMSVNAWAVFGDRLIRKTFHGSVPASCLAAEAAACVTCFLLLYFRGKQKNA